MRDKYKFKVDFEAKQFVRIHLKWDYIHHKVIYSTEGYIKQALEELKHSMIA